MTDVSCLRRPCADPAWSASLRRSACKLPRLVQPRPAPVGGLREGYKHARDLGDAPWRQVGQRATPPSEACSPAVPAVPKRSSRSWSADATRGRPEVTERTAGTHKRTRHEHQAAFGRLSDRALSGLNPSWFSVACSGGAQI